ncbi:MAG: hypothetical protein AB7G25_08720 [Sphingomonadaceae bacterium]
MSDPTQSELSQKAHSSKRANKSDKDYLDRQTDTPNEGAVTRLNPDAPAEGDLDAEGHRPVLERSRKVR